MFTFLSWHFDHVGKTAWLARYGWFQNLWRHNRVSIQLKYTYYTISHELKTTRQLKNLFLLFKKALYEVKASGLQLSFNIFQLPSTWHTTNTTSTRLWIQRYAQFRFFIKGSGNSLSTKLCVWFFKENVSRVMFYYMTKFHCLIAFTSGDIGQYVSCNWFFPRLWRHIFLS